MVHISVRSGTSRGAVKAEKPKARPWYRRVFDSPLQQDCYLSAQYFQTGKHSAGALENRQKHPARNPTVVKIGAVPHIH